MNPFLWAIHGRIWSPVFTESVNFMNIRHLTIGSGRPKICVPLVSSNLEDLEKECASLSSCPLDMLEWRVDYLLNQENFHATKDLETAYAVIRRHFKDVPLLTTVRTKSQGGAHKTPGGEYVSLLSLIIRSHWADVLDVEYGHEVLDTKVLIKQAHEQGIPVLMSYHKFQRAMSETELIDTYENMASFKADILKIAVMSRVPRDTASLLSAAARVREDLPETPVIAIGMGQAGQLTRIVGSDLGAPITFAAGQKASAPGQLTAAQVKAVLDVLYS